MKTVLYARVSTADLTIVDQKFLARTAGFSIDMVVSDDGISGIRLPLAERPQGKKLFDKLSSGDTLVVHWIDRLGCNNASMIDTIREFMRLGIVVKTVVGGFTFDKSTKDPIQQAIRDALIAFMAASVQVQAEAVKEAQRVGIERAKAAGEKKYLGCKATYSREQFDAVRDLLAQGMAVSTIAAVTGLRRQTIYRMRDDAAGAEAALIRLGR